MNLADLLMPRPMKAETPERFAEMVALLQRSGPRSNRPMHVRRMRERAMRLARHLEQLRNGATVQQCADRAGWGYAAIQADFRMLRDAGLIEGVATGEGALKVWWVAGDAELTGTEPKAERPS